MDNILGMSPTKSRLFIWFAKYDNNDYFYEYDTKFNEFDKINKDIMVCFGLTGMNMIMSYDVATGIFDICGRKLSFMYKDKDGNEFKLTDTGKVYNDCISYKSAETVLIGQNQGRSIINGYHFGYKVKLDKFNLKIIVHLPMEGSVNMDISITSDENMDGELQIIRNEQLYKTVPMQLNKNQTSNVNWIVV